MTRKEFRTRLPGAETVREALARSFVQPENSEDSYDIVHKLGQLTCCCSLQLALCTLALLHSAFCILHSATLQKGISRPHVGCSSLIVRLV